MTVLVDQAVPCANCPRGNCLPASHSMQHLGSGGWKYLGCRVHRACQEYTPAPPDPAVVAELPPLPPKWSAPLSTPPEAADAPPTPEPPTVDHDDPAEAADQPADTTTEPVGQLLAAWNSWWCKVCGSRWFEPSPCCGKRPLPVRMEMRTR
jgi:hypothetical protein